jgi:transposase
MHESRPEHVTEAESGTAPLSALQNSHAGARERTLSRDEMESRRMEAAGHLLKGRRRSLVAAKFGVSRTTVSRWSLALNASGLEALRKHKVSGRPRRMTPGQTAQIVDVFEQGPSALGFSSERWTATLLAKVIEERFGVHYSRDYVGRMVSKLGMHNQPASESNR